jgi:hypothetical protein
MNIWNFLNLGVWIPAVAPVAQVGDVFYQGTVTIAGQVYDFVITIHCNNIAYGTFLHGFVSDIVVLNMIRITVPGVNVNQLINNLVFGYQSLFGKLKTDSIDPRTYITSATFQQQIADIPINLPIDKNLILCYYQEFDCQQLNLILSVSKIQPLQLKP